MSATIKEELIDMKKEKDKEWTFSKELDDMFKTYKRFSAATEGGKHGKTAQFWIQYINKIHLYHEFSRSIRNGDLELFIKCFPRIIYFLRCTIQSTLDGL